MRINIKFLQTGGVSHQRFNGHASGCLLDL